MAIEDVDLLRAVDEEIADAPDGRQQAYLNLMVNYWHAMWELGEIDDEELEVCHHRSSVERLDAAGGRKMARIGLGRVGGQAVAVSSK